jgi:hypothetical protein
MALGNERLFVNLQSQIAREREVAAQRQIIAFGIAKAEDADRIG